MSSLWCDQRAGNSNVLVADVLLVDTRNRIPSHMFCPKILDNNNRYKMLKIPNQLCVTLFSILDLGSELLLMPGLVVGLTYWSQFGRIEL